MNYSLFKWSRKTCSGHDSNTAILQASREYGETFAKQHHMALVVKGYRYMSPYTITIMGVLVGIKPVSLAF